MKTIYLPAGTEYVCVAELLRCVYLTGRDGVYEVYESEAGELELRMKGCAPSKNEMKTQFNAFCKRESIEPTSQIDRWEKNYTGEGLQDGMYEVTVTEAERFAAPFRVSFQVEGPAQTAATPVPAVAVGVSGDVEPDKAEPAKPLQRTAAQDSAILCEIDKQGYDPLALPKNPPGKSGAKAAIRAALSKNLLFTGATVFNKAWERLTDRADIVIQG